MIKIRIKKYLTDMEDIDTGPTYREIHECFDDLLFVNLKLDSVGYHVLIRVNHC